MDSSRERSASVNSGYATTASSGMQSPRSAVYLALTANRYHAAMPASGDKPGRRLRRVLATIIATLLLFSVATCIGPVTWSDPARRVEVRIGVGRVAVMWERGLSPVGWNPTD